MYRPLIALFAIALIFVGLIVLPMPIPFGAIMIVGGIVLLVSASATAAWMVRSFRQKHPRADVAIRKVEERLPEKLKRVLKRTDP